MMKQKMNKKNRLILIFALLSMIAVLSLFIKTEVSSVIGKPLQIIKEENIPLLEISGSFAIKKKNEAKSYLYIVGDASAEIYKAEIDTINKTLKNGYSINLKEKILDRFSLCHSDKIKACKKLMHTITQQWEGVFVDPLERIYLLNEPLGTIIVYDQKNENISHTISFDSFTTKNNQPPSFQDENSQGEGFLPLNNGHILVIKESKPPIILEFGPQKNKAQGYNKNLLVDENHNFILQKEAIKMKPLASWRLPKEYSSCDLSELSYTSKGELEILSQRCKAIFKISDLNPEKSSVSILESWSLPEKLAKAEAFISLDNLGEFLVFEDKKDTLSKNTFFVKAKQK